MDHIVIRKAAMKDLKILLQFEQKIINAERSFDSTLKSGFIQYYELAEMITDPHTELVVAELGDKIVGTGYARIEDSKPYLDHDRHVYFGFMYVEQDYRRLGINRKILNVLKQWAKLKNVTELRLNVYFNNQAAIKSYETAGFTNHMLEMRMKLD